MTTIATKNDCEKNSDGDYKRKWVWCSTNWMKDDCKNAKFQLFRARDGFGCEPNSLGQKVYGVFACDCEKTYVRRGDIIGVATSESIEEWKRIFPECATNIGEIIREEEEK